MVADLLPRSTTRETRLLLTIAIEARQQYADYLRAVADGLRRADAEERDRLLTRCEETIAAWRSAHAAWNNNDWLAPRPQRGQ